METERGYLFNSNILTDKHIKNLEMLDLIRKKGPISRTDISKWTGINIVSISNYMKNYMDKKLVLEKGFDVSSGGRRPELMELNARENFVIGLEVRKLSVSGVLADIGMKPLKKTNASVNAQSEIGQKTTSLIEELIKNSGVTKESIRAIGIGGTGPGLDSLARDAEDRFKIHTFFADDAICAAFAEKALNPDADVKNFLYVHSDLGEVIFIHEQSFFRASDDKDRDEKFKYLMPWNEALGIIETARNEVSRGIGTKIVVLAKGDINKISKEVVMESARQGDEVASNIIQGVGINLGIRIAYLANLINPDVVVIGGGIEKAEDLILGNVRKIVKKLSLSGIGSSMKIMLSAMGEDAVEIGAVSLAVREIFLRA